MSLKGYWSWLGRFCMDVAEGVIMFKLSMEVGEVSIKECMEAGCNELAKGICFEILEGSGVMVSSSG